MTTVGIKSNMIDGKHFNWLPTKEEENSDYFFLLSEFCCLQIWGNIFSTTYTTEISVVSAEVLLKIR